MMLMCPAHVAWASLNARTSGARFPGVAGWYSEQNDAGLFQGAPTLDADLPEVLVERQHDACVGLRQIQQGEVACSGEVRAGPENVVAFSSKGLYNRLRKVLIGEEAHLRWNRERLIFVGQIAGVRQTGKDVLSGQARIVDEDVVLGLASGEEFKDELGGEARTADDRLTSQDLGVDDDALGQRHTNSLPCRWPVRPKYPR